MFDTPSDRVKLDVVRHMIKKYAAERRKLGKIIPPDGDLIEAFDKLIDLINQHSALGVPAWGVATGAAERLLREKHGKTTKHR